MRAEYRRKKDGSHYYSFLYTDPVSKQRKRVPQEEVVKLIGRKITTPVEAQRVMRLLMPEYESEAKRLQKLESGFKRHQRYQELVEMYKAYQQKNAPRSPLNNVSNLKHYVFGYFFGVARVADISKWHWHYQGFQDWLETRAYSIRQPEKLISYRTKNHCIASLNTFLKMLYRSRELKEYFACERFPSHLCNRRSVQDVVKPQELQDVSEQLEAKGYLLEAIFMRLLYHTGLRFNEALGVSLEDIYPGQLKQSILSEKLESYSIPVFGYIVLKSQPEHLSRRARHENGQVKRKPLKGAKSIDHKNARMVPVVDGTLWQQLKQLHNQQVDAYQKGKWGQCGSQYILFEGIERNRSLKRLYQAYDALGLRRRSWHCLRHSCATHVLGRTGDLMLARIWLGHKSTHVIERYVHVHEELIREAEHRNGDMRYQILA